MVTGVSGGAHGDCCEWRDTQTCTFSPMLAFLRAGASLTPSPVTATTLPAR